MTSVKPRFLVSVGILFIAGLFLAGCAASLDLFNNTFLDEFQPFGRTSLDKIRGKGPLIIVFQNLTEEARHQETVQITANYIDERGGEGRLTVGTIPAVPVENRDPASPDFDNSYRRTLILNCGVREITFNATVSRTLIESREETIDLPNQESQDIDYCTAFVERLVLPDDEVELVTTRFADIDAIPSLTLRENVHFKCGDVIVVGVLDQRRRNQQINFQEYECANVELRSLSQTFPPNDPRLRPAVNPRFLFDPAQEELRREYRYPTGYIVIPIIVPNIEGIDNMLPILRQIAAEQALQ